MKKWLILATSVFILAACNSNETKSVDKEKVEEPELAEVTADPQETNNNSGDTDTEKEEEVSEIKPLTLEDFNNRYELDTELSEPFIEGKFELNDGTVVTADWYFYLEGDTFHYATATFIEGELVQAQLELKDNVTKEEVLTELGLSNEVVYDLNEVTNIVDIVIDKRFADSNIKRLPNEWD